MRTLTLLVSSVLLAAPLPDLQISSNQRFLITATGKPFFYLGDTAWELFHRLTREEAVRYLDDRAGKGFTSSRPSRLPNSTAWTTRTPMAIAPCSATILSVPT